MKKTLMTAVCLSMLVGCSSMDNTADSSVDQSKYGTIKKVAEKDGDEFYSFKDKETGCEYLYFYNPYGADIVPRIDIEDGVEVTKGCTGGRINPEAKR